MPRLADAPLANSPAQVGSCPHCGAAVEGPVDAFCCRGCELASGIIHDAGLERYYRERTEFAPRPAPVEAGWNDVPTQAHADGSREVSLAVDGLRCASCVWVTERLLEATDGVKEAAVSYATGRASVRWDPQRIELEAIASRIAALGYRPRLLTHERSPDRGLLLRLGMAVFVAMNVMLLSVALYAGWLSSMEPRFVRLFQWSSLVLATPVALWCAEPFLRGALTGLRRGVLHMDVPIALAVVVLYVQGLVGTFAGWDTYLDSLTMLVALLLAGRVLEGSARRRAADAAVLLSSTVPRTALRLEDGSTRRVSASDLSAGDRVLVGAGEEIPADGEVVDGSGLVRMALITGEGRLVPMGTHDGVVAGSVLESGHLTIRVQAVGGDTVVGRMAERVKEAVSQGMRPGATDRIAPWFTAATLLVASLTFLGWWVFRGPGAALEAAVAVLVVACPCALALSRPLAAAAGLGAAARRGLLLRSGEALLDLADVDLAVLDKTGTLTGGAPVVGSAPEGALRIAAGLERGSSHPIARAILDAARDRGLPLPLSRNLHEEIGVGVSGEVDGIRYDVVAGGPDEVVVRRSAGEPVGAIQLIDQLRAAAKSTVVDLQLEGLEPILMTGDHAEVAERVANDIGVARSLAEVHPEEKADWVRDARDDGFAVAFVGDGVNDAPALAAANVGIAMSDGAMSSVLVADGVIVNGSLTGLVGGVRAGRAMQRAIRTNQVRSISYNLLAVSAAAAGWVNPLVAAILMPLSSLMVIARSVRVEADVRAAEAA